MKTADIRIPAFVCFCSMMLLLAVAGVHANAQDNGDKARIQLDYFYSNTTGHELVATVKTKEGPSYVNVPDVPVQFFLDSLAQAMNIGTVISNEKGMAVLTIPSERLQNKSEYRFFAAIIDNERFRDYDRDIEITPASLSVDFKDEEEAKTIQATITSRDSTGTNVPVSGVDVKVYVKRLFGELPVSVDFNTTNSEGQTDIDFPKEIPGDTAGILTVIIKVPDHELYGNLVYREDIAWGQPIVVEHEQIQGELWSARSNAPLYLILLVNTILIGIWGTIAYIVVLLFRINNFGRKHIKSV
jgi:hypothetical protein